jgi:hypothetical protein
MKLINPECRIENTNLCNAFCTVCPRSELTRDKAIMPDAHFFNLVAQAKALGANTISVFGFGEPLMDPRIDSKIKHCTDLGLETFITTNASMLGTDLSARLLKAGLGSVRFSAHGTFDYYNKVHRGLSWNDTMKNIFNFIAMNNKRFGHKCRVEVTSMPMNGQAMEDIVRFWEPHIDGMQVWKPHNWAGVKKFRVGERKLKTCGRPETGPVQINADGKMMVCCMDFDAELTVGDTYTSSIEDILKGERFNEIRRKHESGDLSGLICDKCDQLYALDESPLLYSSNGMAVNMTSSTKYKLNAVEL